MKFSLIIPCYNEAENLPPLIDRCRECFSNQIDIIEILLVDNASTDNSPHILKKLISNDRLIRSIRTEKNQGYGAGIISGLKEAKGDILGWTHADMQTDPQDFIRGKEFFDRHGKNIFVKGQRYGRPLSDTIFTIGMSFFETILLTKPLWDINAQPTMLSQSFFKTWENPAYDFSLDLYAYYKARKSKLPIFRFPVKVEKRLHGTSSWNTSWVEKMKLIKRTIHFSLQLRKRVHYER